MEFLLIITASIGLFFLLRFVSKYKRTRYKLFSTVSAIILFSSIFIPSFIRKGLNDGETKVSFLLFAILMIYMLERAIQSYRELKSK